MTKVRDLVKDIIVLIIAIMVLFIAVMLIRDFFDTMKLYSIDRMYDICNEVEIGESNEITILLGEQLDFYDNIDYGSLEQREIDLLVIVYDDYDVDYNEIGTYSIIVYFAINDEVYIREVYLNIIN